MYHLKNNYFKMFKRCLLKINDSPIFSAPPPPPLIFLDPHFLKEGVQLC